MESSKLCFKVQQWVSCYEYYGKKKVLMRLYTMYYSRWILVQPPWTPWYTHLLCLSTPSIIPDEYWSNHPELHDIPIYYASVHHVLFQMNTGPTILSSMIYPSTMPLYTMSYSRWILVQPSWTPWYTHLLCLSTLCIIPDEYWSNRPELHDIPIYYASLHYVLFQMNTGPTILNSMIYPSIMPLYTMSNSRWILVQPSWTPWYTHLLCLSTLCLIPDEYWSNHPELHDIPIYYAYVHYVLFQMNTDPTILNSMIYPSIMPLYTMYYSRWILVQPSWTPWYTHLLCLCTPCIIPDEYWSNHPELHDIPIYYASVHHVLFQMNTGPTILNSMIYPSVMPLYTMSYSRWILVQPSWTPWYTHLLCLCTLCIIPDEYFPLQAGDVVDE